MVIELLMTTYRRCMAFNSTSLGRIISVLAVMTNRLPCLDIAMVPVHIIVAQYQAAG